MKEYDLFQSYSHTDNFSPKNWAKDFHETLKSRLEVITPPELTFRTFLDERSRDLNDLPANIASALDHARFLVIIYSPAYLKSEWCRLERAYFLRSSTKDDVFKVVKYDSGKIKTPNELMTQIEYRFYKTQDGHPIELDLGDEEYKTEMNRLAHDLIEYLDRKKDKARAKVFLAETEPFSWSARVKLSNELKANDVLVYPSEVLELGQLENRSLELMSECSMSIHVLSPKAGIAEKSIEQIQLDTAKKLAAAGKLDVKIWIPKEIANDQELLQIALEDNISSDRYDVTIGSFEKFKGSVLSLLSAQQ